MKGEHWTFRKLQTPPLCCAVAIRCLNSPAMTVCVSGVVTVVTASLALPPARFSMALAADTQVKNVCRDPPDVMCSARNLQAMQHAVVELSEEFRSSATGTGPCCHANFTDKCFCLG